jgi:F-type H+-transporting ATPase subunit epsilon
MSLHLKVITPKKLVLEEDIVSLTLPTSMGQITILPHHEPLLSLLKEGVMIIKTAKHEELFSIGGGYVETDGSRISVLVSRAYNQNEIDEHLTEKALEKARNILQTAKDKMERMEAISTLRRSQIDLDLLHKIRRKGKN